MRVSAPEGEAAADATPTDVPGDSLPLDSDGDGVEDADDRCPTEPETFNGFEDEEGCPDALPVRITGCPGPALARPSFAARSHAIREPDRAVLKQLGAVMRDFPALRVRLIGHADVREGRTEAVRVSLGLRRAEAIFAHLVHHERIEPARLEVESRGTTEPIDPGYTARGRAHNRRVEFEVVP